MEKKKTTKKVAARPAKVAAKPNKGNNKRAGIIGLGLIVLALAISIGTYAYYRTTITGTVTGTILEWECTANNSATSFTAALGELYPGKTGDISITLGVKNFSADYTISLSDPVHMDNINFKHGTTTLCKAAGTPSGCTATYTETVNGTGSSTKTTGTTLISYEWPGGTAGSDTPVAIDTTATIKINIVCTQNNVTPYGQS